MNWYKQTDKDKEEEDKEEKDLYIGQMDTTQRPGTNPKDSNDQVRMS